MKSGDIVLADSTVIIQAHKVRCWPQLADYFRMETVETCVTECATGDLRRGDRVKIEVEAMRRQMTIHKAVDSDFVRAALVSMRFETLDDGEKELMAYAYGHADDLWFLSSQDGACVRVGHELGLLDRFVSFEELVTALGLRIECRKQFSKKWLERLRTQLKLEDI
jgi:hypothetical protein